MSDIVLRRADLRKDIVYSLINYKIYSEVQLNEDQVIRASSRMGSSEGYLP